MTKATKPVFLKPGDSASWEEDKSDVEALSGTKFVYNPNISLALEQQRQRLPISRNRDDILYLLEEYQTLVLVGDTGCGKSTQLPQYLLEAGWSADGKVVGVTEPRRVAATSLASRVSEENGSVLGQTVGYSIRFDDCCQKGVTKIKYMTEGILMREMMADPLLRDYSVIMLDEVHERTVFTDILMGLLKKILRKQKKLRLVVASATMDAEHLCNFFNQSSEKDKKSAVIMSVEGKQFHVQVHYLKEPVADYVQGSVDTAVRLHQSEPAGDVLCFLTGQEEVDRAVAALKRHAASSPRRDLELVVLPMYGSLPNADQLQVFQSPGRGRRKIVVATNIAETSVTIPGIVYVVDCGFVKTRWYNPGTFCDGLVIVPTSRAAAEQRAGRAGRVRPGKVYRLYPEQHYACLPVDSVPEMQRLELSAAVLQLLALGIDNVLRFSFPAPPPARHLCHAYELLHALGAVTDSGSLSQPLGLQMAELPLPPLHAKALLASGEMGCSEEMASVLSLLQVQSVWVRPGSGAAAIKARVERRKFEVEEGDLLTLLNVYMAYRRAVDTPGQSSKAWCQQHFINHRSMKRASEIRTQMLGLLARLAVPVVSADVSVAWCRRHFINHRSMKRASEIRTQMLGLLARLAMPVVSADGDTGKVQRCITAGFFPNAAYLHPSGVYHMVRGGEQLHIHPTSVLYTQHQPTWVLFCELVQSERLYMREVTTIDPDWLQQLCPHFYHKTFDTDSHTAVI